MPLLAASSTRSQENITKENQACRLDVVAPFIVEDAALGIHSELILTSDSFSGAAGHADGKDATEYEIYLYDAEGQPMGDGGIARRVTAKAMNTTVIPVRELVGQRRNFWGGMKVRLRPKDSELSHAGDLFSSAFVRWQTAESFDNIHANPDPPQWQNTTSFFYAMPFPSLAEYECVFSLFNPNDQRSAGELVIADPLGKRLATLRYELKPHASLLFDLNSGSVVNHLQSAKVVGKHRSHGLLSVVNEEGAAKSFGFLMIRRSAQKRFSIEHPIHQGVFKQKPVAVPFDAANQFKAKNVLYSPLLFRNKKIGGLTFNSKFYLGAGLPLEEALWLYPFAVDERGEVVWSALTDKKLASAVPAQIERGVIKLAAHQSCALDPEQLSFGKEMSGGLAVAISPETNHTLFKVAVRVEEWDAYAFTHFRPGLRSARWYQTAKPRGGLATDYIVSGARLAKNKTSMQFDELIGVVNIDDQGLEARPVLEVFGAHGLIAKVSLGVVPPFACRHFLLSELVSGEGFTETLSLRLVDERATLLMSAMHIDYARQDIALDHGSDRFSTFLDFSCQ
ncbi:MAG TPA: hypothetical protein PLD20_00615 [Blastocatellia bacterium]|nr:hypothetical protein [Blastocatellia bacterium]HMX24189.1 hypothetical protein [Blastocatellia bacterium]HMY72249.1 hypothetical protein [Blastocatellia bacterium]HMZ16436.1 hypothetical protein [Blastocatellia bacterium]HNG31558.1 hypothetical protein [Blastocatellia bacterium]